MRVAQDSNDAGGPFLDAGGPSSVTALYRLITQRKQYWGNVSPIDLRSVYDESKRYTEALFMAYREDY